MLGKLRRRSLDSADVDVDGSRKVARADVRMQVTVVRHENAFRPVYTDGYRTYVYTDRRKFDHTRDSSCNILVSCILATVLFVNQATDAYPNLRISPLVVNGNRFSTRYKMSGVVATFTIRIRTVGFRGTKDANERVMAKYADRKRSDMMRVIRGCRKRSRRGEHREVATGPPARG